MRRVFGRLREAGVLGMNRRNAEFIMRCNARSLFPLVDDKIFTKRLAERYQIPAPPTYAVIESEGQVAHVEELLRGYSEFAVKPARGAGGSGIILITGRSAEKFVKSSGRTLTREELIYHLSDILSGIYSLAGLPDRAILEGLVRPDPVFGAISYQGVPDIRVVVFRGVPVMAMVRLPTKASDGKANLHRGAIGAGVDIATGRTLTAVHRSKVVTQHPDTRHSVSGIEVPHWEQMLQIAAKATDMTGLGYLGVDMVLDEKRGPILLELNARPGLAIQVANRSGLLRRLEAIEKAPRGIFASPETRVAWARENFRIRSV